MGAFYLFFRVDQFFQGDDDSALGFCERLMQDEQLALVPGDAFGDKRWVRLSFAASEKDIKKGLERLERFVANAGN
jgi:aspartate aminotransferase